MIINTKFNHLDKVQLIQNFREKRWVKCSFCNGTGRITGADRTTKQCIECHGDRGSYQYDESPKWRVAKEMTVGEVQVTTRCATESDALDNIFTNYGSQKAYYSERYMCYETGIGSGTLWSTEDLFHNKMDAANECDRRNSIK